MFFMQNILHIADIKCIFFPLFYSITIQKAIKDEPLSGFRILEANDLGKVSLRRYQILSGCDGLLGTK